MPGPRCKLPTNGSPRRAQNITERNPTGGLSLQITDMPGNLGQLGI
jgi:hypothetical protein